MASATGRRSRRQADARKRSIYVDPETDDDFEVTAPASPQPTRRRAKVARISSTRSSVQDQAAPKRQPPARKRTRRKKSVAVLGRPRKARASVTPASAVEPFSGPSDGRIPDWTSLPVTILRDIFTYASHPSHETATQSRTNKFRLATALRVCRAFTLPALEALYLSPPLSSTAQLHSFLDLLCIPDERRLFDYNVKVKRLDINVQDLAYVAHNKPPFDVSALLAQVPQLQHVAILHPSHTPPYRPVQIQRWSFAARELFAVLLSRGIKLRSWRWSRETLPKSTPFDLYSMMYEIHQSPAFERMTHLTVCGFSVFDSPEPLLSEDVAAINKDGDDATLPGLATSISQIPNLQSLSFISCDLIMDKFLLRLPQNLHRLELSNCLEVTSDMMLEFFNTSGALLQHLTLNNNPALNLSFLTGLQALCPRLRALLVDLHYYSERLVISDAEPLYDQLLAPNEFPTWPSTMQHIEITHAKKWTSEGAQNLFRSLVEGSSQLPDLRCLVLHAHIDIPWRDRVGFRDQWIHRLRRVFFRRSKPPRSDLGSLRQFRMWNHASEDASAGSHGILKNQDIKRADTQEEDDDDTMMLDVSSHNLEGIGMAQVQVTPHKPSKDTIIFSNDPPSPVSGPNSRAPRRSKRVAETIHQQQQQSALAAFQRENQTNDEDANISDNDGTSTSNEDEAYPEDVVQGLCTTVDIRIDNQRPREDQWTADDFLDSEVSGDEDWLEDADSPDEGYAW